MSSDTGKGFKVTMGVMAAIFVVFVVLPLGTCAGCLVLGAGASAVNEQAEATRVENGGQPAQPDLVIDNITWKLLTDNEFMHEATYKFDATNNKTRVSTESFSVEFLDGDGLVVVEDIIIFKKIPAGATETFTGKTIVQTARSAGIVSIKVKEK